jgi:hypothetical protein
MQEEMYRRTREAPLCSWDSVANPRWVIVRWLYAFGVSYQAYYSEVGKASHKGKDLTEARRLQRKLMLDM